MHSPPFIELTVPRQIDKLWLPAVLHQFYRTHEGVGLESPPQDTVRLCTLDELRQMAWADLHIFGSDDPPEGWASFAAIQIGVSLFFDEILYVLEAPCAPKGSIMAIGVDMAGPGGVGEQTIECSLVLASSFETWVQRQQEDDWIDYGIIPGAIKELTPQRCKQLYQHFISLNPTSILATNAIKAE